MRESGLILNRLLDKYENSKHLSQPGTSLRRVMLRVARGEFPEYDYEDAAVRDAYNAAAKELEQRRLVQLEWVKGRPVLSAVVLNLDRVMPCYAWTGRVHPKERGAHVAKLISSSLAGAAVPWIRAWQEDVCAAALEKMQVPGFCKKEDRPLRDLLLAFREYAALPGSVTMRAFSGKCFHDTKYFERNVREIFLRIARKYHAELALACEEGELSERDQLAFLGIYARPELYELAGNCDIRTQQGVVSVGAAGRYGLAVPSALVDLIAGVDLKNTRCITLIENKTNYDEYLLAERQPGELVLYHGGFLSPQKRKLFSLIAAAAAEPVQIRFWADIDLGGFRMFQHLQGLFPRVVPMRMSGRFVEEYHQNGLARSEEYLSKLRAAARNGEYALFEDAIRQILKYGVTIEQEIFLNDAPAHPSC